MNRRALFLLLFVALLAARLCHSGILWAEETLPLAAAQQMRLGHLLYRDIWFDKPPLLAAVCLLWGAVPGWPLRVAGALYGLLACTAAYACARQLWGEREARLAAALLAFFLIFDLPAAVTPLAADLLLIAPHLAAVWLASARRPFWSGVVAGVALLVNPKGLIVAAVCAAWNPGGIPLLAAGFASTSALAGVWLWQAGALGAYWDEVWLWGRVYAANTFLPDPLRNAALRTLHGTGFHLALVVAAVYALRRDGVRWRWLVWLGLSMVAVAAGWRFFPRYFFQLLVPATLLAARGFVLLPRRYAAWAALLLVVPLARFAPRYGQLAAGRSEAWSDTAMDRDSRAAAALTRAQARAGDTLFVWGFRPELYVYTRLAAASRFLDSQPLTGVPADRHLTQSSTVDPSAARAHRAELAGTRPTFILDGLGLYNPSLAIGAYADLRPWLAGYREAGRTGETVVYRRVGP